MGNSSEICTCRHLPAVQHLAFPTAIHSSLSWTIHRLQWRKRCSRVSVTVPHHQQHLSEALLCSRKGGNGGNGGNGGKAGKGGRSPNRDKRNDKKDNKDQRKEKDLRTCFHCPQRGKITKNCLSKQRGDPPKSADSAAEASTETTWTLTTSIENYWMVASTNASSSNWFIDCVCTTHISGHRSMFITYTEYPPNTRKVKGYNGVTSFASG